MPLYTTQTIVLRRISFGEVDRIVTLFSREHGKITGIAKGARKPTSRKSGATEVLTYGKFQLATGRNLDIIGQVDVKESFPRIHTNLSRLVHATYLAELLDKLLEDKESNPDIFDLFLSALYLMERENEPEKIARMFELQFMAQLGYEPVLDKCCKCRTSPAGMEYFFSPSMGGLICRECGYPPEDAIKILPETLDAMRNLLAADAPEVERMEIDGNVMDQMARAMRRFIRYRSERELKSMRFLQSLKAEDSLEIF